MPGNAAAHQPAGLPRRVVGQTVSEILRHVQRKSHAHHSESGHVVSGIQQVLAMRRRMHQAFVRLLRASSVGNIFSSLIEMQRAVGGQPLCQRGLSGKLMRKLLPLGHLHGVSARGPRQALIHLQRTDACLRTGLIRQN